MGTIRQIFVFGFILSWINVALGQECSSPQLDPYFEFGYDSQVPFDPTFVGDIIEFDMRDTTGIISTSNSNMNKMYIDAALDETRTKLRIFPTPDMINYESEQTINQIILFIRMSCTIGSREILFRQRIRENNNHDPDFSQSIYEIQIKLPLPQGFDLTFFQEIYARDIDLVNNHVNFTSDYNDLLTVGTADRIGNDQKTFYASIITNQQLLTITNNRLEFEIIATDNGNPPKSSVATIILSTDELSAYIPVPSFERALYTGRVDLNHELIEIESPTIEMSTFSTDITFSLEGDDQDLFQIQTTVLNVITLQTSREITDADLQNKFHFSLILIASRETVQNGSTAILIEIDQPEPDPLIPQPKFEKSLYKGTLDLEQNIDIEAINLILETYHTNVTFQLDEVYRDIFIVSNDNNIVTITLQTPLTAEELQNKLFITLILTANREDVGSDSAVILIDVIQPEPEPPIPQPKFDKSLYKGSLDLTNRFEHEPINLILETYHTNVTFQLDDVSRDKFTISNEDNIVSIALTTNFTEEELQDKFYITMILMANREDVGSDSVVVVIEVAQPEPEPPIPLPRFEKALFTGNLNDQYLLTVENVVLVPETFEPSTTFEIIAGDTSLLTLDHTLNILTISLVRELTEDDLIDKDYLSLIIRASIVDVGSGETVVIITVPPEVCPEPEIVTCPDCPTTIPPPIDRRPAFENQIYSYWIKTEYIGKLGTVLAIVASDPTIQIEYSLDITNEYLEPKIEINSISGEILLIEKLLFGVYTFDVIGMNMEDTLTTTTRVNLTVDQQTVCDGPVTVDKSLMIKYLIENVEHNDVLSTKIGDCNLHIMESIPNDKEYFRIDSSRNMLVSSRLNREDEIFSTMEVPQVQLKLRLTCEQEDVEMIRSDRSRSPMKYTLPSRTTRSIEPTFDDGRWYVITDEIDYQPNITVLNVIIQDENDNAPIFTHPRTSPYLIGYPEPSLAEIILPSHLIRVEAYDIDFGFNAKIGYSIQGNNNNFDIDSGTGIVSPLKSAMSEDDELLLEIIAIDKDGAADGLSSTVQVNVKRLQSRHLTVITIEGYGFKIDEVIINDIISGTGTKFVILQSAHTSITEESYRSRSNNYHEMYNHRANEKIDVLRMIVYAFDSDNQLIETERCQEILSRYERFDMVAMSFDDVMNREPPVYAPQEDNLPLLISVGVLGLLFVVAVVIIFLLWCCLIRPYEYRKMEELIGEKSSQNIESTPPGRTSANIENEKINGSTVLNGSVTKDSDDPIATNNLSRSLSAVLDGEEEDHYDEFGAKVSADDTENWRERQRTTNVTFNEMVERIEIETNGGRDSDNDDDIKL